MTNLFQSWIPSGTSFNTWAVMRKKKTKMKLVMRKRKTKMKVVKKKKTKVKVVMRKRKTKMAVVMKRMIKNMKVMIGTKELIMNNFKTRKCQWEKV